MRFYGNITKVDAEQRMVWGYASTEAVDSDGETIKRSAMEHALEDYMKWANIREMHQPSAVGLTKEATVDDKGLYIGVKVTDDRAWGKVVDTTYKGFSIGGKVLERDPKERKIITKVGLYEISLVDRPANPEATFDVWKLAEGDLDKRDFDAKERKKDAKSGAAMKDGSFPIENSKDLHNAIRLAGNAKDPAAARAHIKRRAAALGLSSEIPDTWKAIMTDKPGESADEIAKAEEVGAVEEVTVEETVEKAAEEQAEEIATEQVEKAADEVVAEEAVDSVAKADALLSAIEASEAPAVVEEVQKSADEMMAELNTMIADLNTKIDGFEAALAEKEVEKAALAEQIDTLTKAASEKEEALTGKGESLTKLADRTASALEVLTKRLDDKDAQIDVLTKRLEEVALAPVPAKTVGPGANFVSVVEKGADAAGGASAGNRPELSDEEVQKVLASMSSEDRAMAMIKSTLKFPRQISVR